MIYTAYDIEQAWGVSNVTLENGRIIAATGGDVDQLNERLTRAKAAGTLNVPAVAPITPRQLRLWLHRNGHLADVVAQLNALPEPAKTEAETEWEYALDFDRNHPLVAQIGAILGFDEAALDAAWREAAAI